MCKFRVRVSGQLQKMNKNSSSEITISNASPGFYSCSANFVFRFHLKIDSFDSQSFSIMTYQIIRNHNISLFENIFFPKHHFRNDIFCVYTTHTFSILLHFFYDDCYYFQTKTPKIKWRIQKQGGQKD